MTKLLRYEHTQDKQSSYWLRVICRSLKKANDFNLNIKTFFMISFHYLKTESTLKLVLPNHIIYTIQCVMILMCIVSLFDWVILVEWDTMIVYCQYSMEEQETSTWNLVQCYKWRSMLIEITVTIGAGALPNRGYLNVIGCFEVRSRDREVDAILDCGVSEYMA